MESAERNELLEIAQEAYIWGTPLVQWAHYKLIRESYYYPPNRPFGRLAIIEDDFAPSQELLYTLIDFDLSTEPQILHLPPIAESRFFSFQFCDKFFNPFHYIGTRTKDTDGGDYAICPPGWSGALPEGVKRVDCPVDRVFCYARTAVLGRSDGPAAVTVASQYAICPLSGYPDGFKGYFAGIPGMVDYFPAPFKGNTEGIRFFDKLSQELVDCPVPPEEQPLLERFSRIGVGPGLWTSELADKEMRKLLAEAIELGQAKIDNCEALADINGWRTPVGAGATYTDFVLRANLQREGGGINVPEEALYYRGYKGPDGEILSSEKRYRLHFPADALPPVNAFWSLSQLDMKSIPIKNPINRFAVSTVMDDFEPNADGSITVLLQRDQPDASQEGMWLPTGEGEFQLFMRFYLPRDEFLSGAYQPPGLELLD